MREEFLEIYSSSGKKTGRKATKSHIHKNGLFHATVHIWIFSEKGNVLIQKRSTKKKLNPGVWDVSVAGHIEYKEDIKAAAIRETFEETGSKAKIKMAYTMFSLPHINQVHMFFLADLLDDNFGPTFESSDVQLFDTKDILWDEIAFPTVKKTLEYYIEDLKKNEFIFREEDIKLW